MNISTFPINEYNYLKELYESTNGSNWFENTNWNFENINLYNPCLQEWYGLTAFCSPDYETLSGTYDIYLTSNNLIGKLPSILSNFPYLFIFSAANNQLTGSLPSFIHCPRLINVILSQNYFQGLIPDSFIENSPLVNYISVTTNYLNGTIPENLYYKQHYYHFI